MIKKQVAWIDNLKGLAIIAVVIGHMASPINSFLYSWHIPLFFFVSGLLINKDRPIKNSIKKDFIRLMVPFFIFTIVGLLAEYIKRWLFPGFAFINGKINLNDELLGIFWWMDYLHLHQYGFVLWFLPALFWAKNIYLALLKLIKNKYIISAVSLVILLFVAKQSWILPFCFNEALIGLFWLSVGWLVTGRFWVAGLLVMLFLPIPETNIAFRIINSYGVIYSLVAINSAIGIVKLIPKSVKLLEMFGKQTLPILVIHPYLNNLAYILIIYLLKWNWPLEMLVAVSALYLVVTNINPMRVALAKIYAKKF